MAGSNVVSSEYELFQEGPAPYSPQLLREFTVEWQIINWEGLGSTPFYWKSQCCLRNNLVRNWLAICENFTSGLSWDSLVRSNNNGFVGSLEPELRLCERRHALAIFEECHTVQHMRETINEETGVATDFRYNWTMQSAETFLIKFLYHHNLWIVNTTILSNLGKRVLC